MKLDKRIVGLVDYWIDRLANHCPQGFQKSIHSFILLWLLAGVMILLPGCGYTLGPTNGVVAREKKIQITPFLNHTLEPRLGDTVTTSLRRSLQRDGTYHLATGSDADIIVTGVLTKYQR